MVYPYPPSKFAENLALTIVIHLVLAAAALVPIFLVWVRTNKPAKKQEIWQLFWPMLLVPFVVLLIARSLPGEWIPFIVLYTLFFETVALVAVVMVARRLEAQGQSTPVVRILASLLLLGLLIAVLLPSVPSAREAAKRMQCSNNMKSIVLGLLNYESRHGSLPAAMFHVDHGPTISWRALLLPELEREDLWKAYDHATPWDSLTNSELAKTEVPEYSCPTNPIHVDEVGRYFTAYARPVGRNVKTLGGDQVTLNRASMIAVIEACGQNIVWTEPRDPVVDVRSVGVNLPGAKRGTSDGVMSSYHTGGVNTAMLDGSVSFISEKMDPLVLKRMLEGE